MQLSSLVPALALSLTLLACSDLQCPRDSIRKGDVCHKCDPGFVPVKNECKPLLESAQSDASAAGETNDDGGLSSSADASRIADGGNNAADGTLSANDASITCENAGCSQLCSAADASTPTCSCNPGTKLGQDGKTCVAFEWGPVVRLSAEGRYPSDPALAVAGNGDAFVAWSQSKMDLSDSEIWGSARVASGWQAPSQLSTEGKPGQPSVALSASGRGLVAWTQVNTSNYTVVWARRTEGAFTDLAIPLHSPGLTKPSQLDVVVDTHGDGTVIWTSYEVRSGPPLTDFYTKQSATFVRAAQQWSQRPLAIGVPNTRAGLAEGAIASRSLGRYWYAWTQRAGAPVDSDLWLTVHAGSQWLPAFKASTTALPSQPALVLEDDGNPTVAWIGVDAEVHIATCKSSGCDAAKTLGPTVIGSKLLMARDGLSRILVVWDNGSEVLWSERSAGGDFTPAKSLAVNPADFELVMDVGGNATLVWSEYAADNSTQFVRYSRRAAGAAWETPRALQTEDGDATSVRLGIDEQGHATAVWRQLSASTPQTATLVSRRLE